LFGGENKSRPIECGRSIRGGLQKYFWKEQPFWGDGYFVCSIGNVSREIVEKAIQTQG
jgi:REP element-mobilizing transposase RayT